MNAYFPSNDGSQLYLYYETLDKPKAGIIYVHGFAEHSGRYKNTFDFFLKNGFSQFIFDNRGHGKSSGRRGDVKNFSDYIEDLHSVIKLYRSICPDTPIFLFGHSLGGLIVFLYGIKNYGDVSGVILSSPAFSFGVKVSKMKFIFGKILNWTIPFLPLKSGIEPSFLSHDKKVVHDYENDKMVFKIATPRWFFESLNAQDEAFENSSKFSLPVLFLQGGDDKIVLPEGTKKIFDRIGSKEKKLKIYENMYHEVLNEVGKEEVFNDILIWLDERLKALK